MAEGFIAAYAVGLTEHVDHGAHRYRLYFSDSQALEAWKERLGRSLIANYGNRWFTFNFWTFEEIYSSWLHVPDEFAGRIIIEHLPNPLDMDPARWGREQYSIPRPKNA
ncbi:hypothetical protein BDV18DRAFT_162492 [Aspergillus unguis]